jgi:large subunit ribosomal protein L15
MNITEITTRAGARPKRKRVGRGEASGTGKTAGRGHKGAGARSGYRRTVLAEGANFPLFRRLPKYGFNNAQFRTDYQIVNVADLEKRFETGSHVTPASLEVAGLIRDGRSPVKVLGNGDLAKKLTVEAHRFSSSAVAKIEGIGGTAKWLMPRPKKKFVKRFKLAENTEAPAGKKAKPAKPQKQQEKKTRKQEDSSEEE